MPIFPGGEQVEEDIAGRRCHIGVRYLHAGASSCAADLARIFRGGLDIAPLAFIGTFM